MTFYKVDNLKWLLFIVWTSNVDEFQSDLFLEKVLKKLFLCNIQNVQVLETYKPV